MKPKNPARSARQARPSLDREVATAKARPRRTAPPKPTDPRLKRRLTPATVAHVPVVPPGFEEHVQAAVAHYWRTLSVQNDKQAAGDADRGNRQAVTGGKQMNGFCELLRWAVIANGMPEASIFARDKLELPGFFRATKKWDLVVVHQKRLVAAVEFKSQAGPSFGNNHPHHNLYFVTSERWDMEVLGGILSSRVALFFVWSYAVKMRGGYLRFQAQYLRRIRLPNPDAIPAPLADALKAGFRARDFALLDRLALEAYGLADLPTFDFVDTRK